MSSESVVSDGIFGFVSEPVRKWPVLSLLFCQSSFHQQAFVSSHGYYIRKYYQQLFFQRNQYQIFCYFKKIISQANNLLTIRRETKYSYFQQSNSNRSKINNSKIFEMSKIVKLAQSSVSQQSQSSANSSRLTHSLSRSSQSSQCSHGQNSPHNHHHHHHHHHEDSQVGRSKQKRAFLKKNSRQFLASSKSINKNNKQLSSEAHKQYDQQIKELKYKDKLGSTRQYQNQQNQQNKRYPVISKQNTNRENSKNNSITVTPRMLPIKPQNGKVTNSITNKQRMKTQSVQLQRNHHCHNQFQGNSSVLNPPQSKDLYFNSETVRIQPKVESFLNCFNKMEGRNKFISNSLDNSQYSSSSYILLQNQNSLQTISLKNSKCHDSINMNQKSKPTPISYLQPNQIQICPELFHLYRTEHLVTEANGCTFSIRIYSKGRKQIKYADGTIELFFNNGTQIKLTRWANGDFKLIDGDKVSYWSEEVCDLDQYFLD